MTFDEWFRSKQGEPYDSMYVFARDAWEACAALKDERIKELEAENDEIKYRMAAMLEQHLEQKRDLLASLNSCRRAIEKGNEVSKRKEKKLLAEIKHWKGNHANEVRLARILKERPDLPIERVLAYEQWGVDQARIKVLEAEAIMNGERK